MLNTIIDTEIDKFKSEQFNSINKSFSAIN